MGVNSDTPVIIKRKKNVVGDGHHGGAWKVAYADFVTAMMAFFMLMWLLNATTEQQRKGLADYFAPTVPLVRVSGGGAEALMGDSVKVEDTLSQSGTGGLIEVDIGDGTPQVDALTAFEEVLLGQGGESIFADEALKHVVTKLTDRGLVLEIFALPEVPLFDGVEPAAILDLMLEGLAVASEMVDNDIAIEVHVAARPMAARVESPWSLSASRANAVRSKLATEGVVNHRLSRVSGYGDLTLADPIPTSVRNNRIEIVFLR